MFLFLPDPVMHLRKLARALKARRFAGPPGISSRLVRADSEAGGVDAADRSGAREYEATGADVNVGARLPTLFGEAGLRPLDVVPTIKVGGPRSHVWKWLTGYFLGILDRYAQQRPLDEARRGGFAAPGSKRHAIGRR